MNGPVASLFFDVHYWCADRPVRSQSAVDCDGCAKLPEPLRSDVRFSGQPSKLDSTNAK
jgi:hypothetical protein